MACALSLSAKMVGGVAVVVKDNGITTYDIEVDNANVFDTGVLSANVIGEVQVLNALAFTGASVGMTVYAEMTRAVTNKLRVAFAGDSTNNYYKVWLTRMA